MKKSIGRVHYWLNSTRGYLSRLPTSFYFNVNSNKQTSCFVIPVVSLVKWDWPLVPQKCLMFDKVDTKLLIHPQVGSLVLRSGHSYCRTHFYISVSSYVVQVLRLSNYVGLTSRHLKSINYTNKLRVSCLSFSHELESLCPPQILYLTHISHTSIINNGVLSHSCGSPARATEYGH